MIDLQPCPHQIVHRELKRRAWNACLFEQASQCWAESVPIDGTLAERYLRSRAVTCRLPKSLRYHPAVRPRRSGHTMPALIGAVRNGSKFIGISTTFLVESGRGAFGARSTQTLGQCGGSAVRLTSSYGPLLVAVGLETALSLMSGLSDSSLSVWAALTPDGMANLSLPHNPGELVLAPDGNAPGREAADKLAERAVGIGWRVSIMQIADGADWNYLARIEAAGERAAIIEFDSLPLSEATVSRRATAEILEFKPRSQA